MATIKAHDGVLAFTSGNSIAVSDIRNPDAFRIVSLPAGTEGKRAKTDEDDGGGSGGAGEGSSSNRVLASGFSRRGRYFAVCDDLKKLHIFHTDSQPWTLLSSRLLARRATSLTFTLDESTVLVADKSGDVYSFSVLSHTNGRGQPKNEDQVKDEDKVKEEDQIKDKDNEVKDGSEVKTEGRLLLGHLSMVLDVCLAQENRYVVTCDRDEKIRISHYPNGYNIHAFCLGHTQFVSCLLYVKEFRVLISGSGDGTVAAWNMQGKQLCRAWLPEKTKPSPVVPQQPEPDGGEQRDLAADEQKEEEESRKMEEEEEERRAVRQLVYCERYRLLVVACYSQAEVEVYQLSAEDSPPTLTHLQTLRVPTAPWDIAWDDSNATLWVLSPEEGATLSAFQLRCEPKQGTEDAQRLYRVMDTDTDNGVWKIIQTVNAQWPFFAESLSVANELAGLWKTCRQDNVLQYQRRKQRRLQGHHQQQKSQPGTKAQKRQKRGKHQAGLTGGAQTSATASRQNSEEMAEKKARQKSS